MDQCFIKINLFSREKAEVLKEKSSQGWNQAKETAKAAAHRATAPTSLHAAEKED